MYACTGGVPSVCGKILGPFLFYKKSSGVEYSPINASHINRCGNVMKFNNIKSVVISIINYLHWSELKYRKAFLEELGVEYCDVIYNPEMTWLRRVLHFVVLKKKDFSISRKWTQNVWRAWKWKMEL